MSHLYSTCWKLCQNQNPPLNGMATPSRFTSPFLARAATCLPIWVLLISVSHDGKRCFTWPIPSVPFLFWSQYDTTQEHFWMELALASPVWGLMMLAYLPQTNRECLLGWIFRRSNSSKESIQQLLCECCGRQRDDVCWSRSCWKNPARKCISQMSLVSMSRF